MDPDLRKELEVERRLLEEIRSDKLMSRVWTKVQRQYANATAREKIISGGNQLGKSDIVVALTAMHLEGRYPAWYRGHRFDRPVVWAVAGPTATATRDNITDKLLGNKAARGSGWLLPSSVSGDDIEYSNKDIVDTFRVPHSSGGYSFCYVFSYDQGARRLQGRTVDGVTIDESPKLEVVEELSQRLNATRGHLLGAVSPKEENAVEVIDMFEDTKPFRDVIYYGINDATWMPQEQRDEIIAKNIHNPFVEATLHGRPVARTGAVFTTPQDEYEYTAKRLDVQRSLIGIDLPHSSGTFACLLLSEANGVWHVEREWKCAGLNIDEYAAEVIKMGGDRIPCAWPHDGGRIVGDGLTAAEAYRELGCNMLPVPAHMIGADGKKHRSVVTVMEEIALALSNGQLRVSSDCPALQRELARFRWAKGIPGKKPQRAEDHLTDALAKAWMMRDHAEAHVPPPPPTPDNSALASYLGRGYNPLAGRFGRRAPWRF